MKIFKKKENTNNNVNWRIEIIKLYLPLEIGGHGNDIESIVEYISNREEAKISLGAKDEDEIRIIIKDIISKLKPRIRSFKRKRAGENKNGQNRIF